MKVKVGTAPDSWGVVFPDDEKQMPWERVLDEMKEAGYEGVELGPWGYFPNTEETLRPELEKRGLKLVAATLQLESFDEAGLQALYATIDGIGALLNAFPGADYMVMLPPPEIPEEGWDAYCDVCQKVYDYAKEKYGLIALMHPEMWSCMEKEETIERFLNQTTVPLGWDTGHHAVAGGNVLGFYRKWHSRIPYIHIKDCRPELQKLVAKGELPDYFDAMAKGIMCGPGEGLIDFVAFRDEMEKAGFDGWVIVEQDCYPCHPDYPMPVAKKTREKLRELNIG